MADTDHVFAFAGLPGSGKSTAAEMAVNYLKHEHYQAITTEVSDFVRTLFESEHDGEINDNELGRWAAEKKRVHGDGYFVRMMAEELDDPYRPLTAISGLRSPKEAEAVRDVFGAEHVTVIGVWTMPDMRFERKYGDAPSEDHPEWETFTERNQREVHDWGCVHFFTEGGPSDYILPNNGGKKNLQTKVESIVREEVLEGSLTANLYSRPPFPASDDPEIIAQYL